MEQAVGSEKTRKIAHEIVLECQPNLRTAFEKCTKHPGHLDFTPVKQFTLQSLPEEYRNRDVYKMCLCLIELTCSIVVTQISDNRTLNESQTKADKAQTIGSGSVFIPRDFVRQSDSPCPCRHCASSSSPSQVWSVVYVTTAYHVVWDDYEAERCEIKLNFDYEGIEEENLVCLTGYKVANHDKDADRTIIASITHDMRTVELIQKARTKARILEEKIRNDNGRPFSESGLAVIVSHPHGQAKMISFGPVVSRCQVRANNGETAWTQYWYKTPTCPGSSGALVWINGQLRVGYRDSDITSHTHSGVCEETRFNISGYGLDFHYSMDTLNFHYPIDILK